MEITDTTSDMGAYPMRSWLTDRLRLGSRRLPLVSALGGVCPAKASFSVIMRDRMSACSKPDGGGMLDTTSSSRPEPGLGQLAGSPLRPDHTVAKSAAMRALTGIGGGW